MFGGLIGRFLSKLPPSIYNRVAQKIGNAIGIKASLPKTTFISKVTEHVAANKFSYGTIVGALGTEAVNLIDFAKESGVDAETIEALSAVIGKPNNEGYAELPRSSYEGADGHIHTVNGMRENKFLDNVREINAAKENIQITANLLGVTPLAAIEISMRLNAIEPQHAALFE